MKTILVQDVFHLQGMRSVVIPEDTPLEDVITRFAHEQSPSGIFLVDSQQRFAGVIGPLDLLEWAQLRLGGRSHDVTVSVRDILRLMFSAKAKDLAHGDWHTLGVKPTDDLETALNQMLAHEVVNIPVLDSDGKIVGDLTLSEVLLKALEVRDQDET